MRLVLSLPLGVLIGLALGAVGGGGSILAVPALVYAVGVAPKAAVTTSLVVVGATAIGALIGHWRAGRVRVGQGLWFGAAGVAGSLVGSRLNQALEPHVLLSAFAGVMVLAAWRMVATTHARDRVRARAPALVSSGHSLSAPAGGTAAPPAPTAVATHPPSRATVPVVAAVLGAGTVVGFMTGLFGVGGGFVIVPALVLVLGFDMPEAVGTSLLVIAVNSAVALATRVGSVGVDWRVAIAFTVAGLLGAVVGGRVAHRAPPSVLTRSFAVLVVCVAAYTLARSLA